MGELTITTFVTLDGVMQAPGGPEEDASGAFPHGGWLSPHFDEDLGRWVSENIAKAGGFLLGRTTYDIFAGYWPNVTDPNDPIAGPLNSLPKHVASRTRDRFDWQASSHVADVVADMPALKAQTDGELQVHGSAGLLQTLIEHELVDEYRIMRFPVVLGVGKRLFGPGAHPMTLQLAASTRTSKGVLVDIYRRGAAFTTATVRPPT